MCFTSMSTFRATIEEQNLGWENCWKVTDLNIGFGFCLTVLEGSAGGKNTGVQRDLDWRGYLVTRDCLL